MKKNIIWIIADQWRADSIGYTGNKAVVTPNLDSLAEDGVSFSNAFCQLPVCVPSRCSFLSGWYPHTHGYRTMHYLMPEYEPNVLKTFKNAGYYVYWGGRNDFLRLDADQDKYCDERHDSFAAQFKKAMSQAHKKTNKDTKPDYTFFNGIKEDIDSPDIPELQAAEDFIKSYSDDKPSFMYLALALPHPPYQIEKKWYDMIDPKKIPDPITLTDEEDEKKPSIETGIRNNQDIKLWDNDKLKDLKRVYYAMGTKLDYYIGKLIDTLKETGHYDDTTIVFMADHGDYSGDFGISEKNQNTFEDVLTNVPLIIKPAEGQGAPVLRSTDALVELIDVQATLMGMNGVEEDHTQFGKSLEPVINGENEFRAYVYTEGGRLKNEPQASESGHTKASPYWARLNEQAQMPQHTKALMIRDDRYKYIYRLYEQDEFYDLEKDSLEKNNEINNIQYATIIGNMKNQLLEHMVSTSDVVPVKEDKRF